MKNIEYDILWHTPEMQAKMALVDTEAMVDHAHHDKLLIVDCFDAFDQAETLMRKIITLQEELINLGGKLKGRIKGAKTLLVQHPTKNVVFSFEIMEDDSVTLNVTRKTIEGYKESLL